MAQVGTMRTGMFEGSLGVFCLYVMTICDSCEGDLDFSHVGGDQCDVNVNVTFFEFPHRNDVCRSGTRRER